MTVKVRGLDVSLGGRPVLKGVSLDVPAGSWTAVIGPNGAGKSTLMRAVLGLVASHGEISVAGRDLQRLKPRQRARMVAYAAQSPNLPIGMTVFDYTLLGRSPTSRISDGRAPATAPSPGTSSIASTSPPSPPATWITSPAASGSGWCWRALAQQTSVLLLDEPTTALDIGHQQQVMELVDQLRLSDELTVVTTIHDLTLAASTPTRSSSSRTGGSPRRARPKRSSPGPSSRSTSARASTSPPARAVSRSCPWSVREPGDELARGGREAPRRDGVAGTTGTG